MSLRVCSLASGSSGNATYIASDQTSILVDSGCSAREVVHRLGSIGVHPDALDAILVTHAHVDHYRSVGTLSCRYDIPVLVDPSTARSLSRRGRYTSWKRLEDTQPLPARVGDLEIHPLDTDHGVYDQVGRTVAFVVEHDRRSVGVVTDLGHVSEEMISRLVGLSVILLEANYDDTTLQRKLADPEYVADWPYLSWVAGDRGHLSNGQCATVLAEIVRSRDVHVLLGHMSVNHVDPRRNNNTLQIALNTVESVFQQRRLPLPHIHPTYRLGRAATQPGALIEI